MATQGPGTLLPGAAFSTQLQATLTTPLWSLRRPAAPRDVLTSAWQTGEKSARRCRECWDAPLVLSRKQVSRIVPDTFLTLLSIFMNKVLTSAKWNLLFFGEQPDRCCDPSGAKRGAPGPLLCLPPQLFLLF